MQRHLGPRRRGWDSTYFTGLRRSLLVWPAGGTDPWAHRGALSEMVERFSPLGFTDFVAFSARPQQQDVFDHASSEILPMLHVEPSV